MSKSFQIERNSCRQISAACCQKLLVVIIGRKPTFTPEYAYGFLVKLEDIGVNESEHAPHVRLLAEKISVLF